MEEAILLYFAWGLGILAVSAWILYFVVVEYRSWKRNNAPTETDRAVAHFKDPTPEASIYGRNHTYTYHVIFHTDSGKILNLYMGRDPYHSIPEGASGELTWQDQKFWKFVLEDGTEINQIG